MTAKRLRAQSINRGDSQADVATTKRMRHYFRPQFKKIGCHKVLCDIMMIGWIITKQ